MTLSLGPSASTGTLGASQVKTDSLSVSGVDIENLITQTLYAAFGVPNLPATTSCTTTRLERGIYQVAFDSTWLSQFSNPAYSILLNERSVNLGVIPAPSKRGVYWKDKTASNFKVVCSEEEDSFEGTENTLRDPGQIDFACIRGGVVFAQGNFNFYTAN